MPSEPADILQRMNLDLRKRLDKIEERLSGLDRLEKKIDDLAYISNNALGFAASSHLRLEQFDERFEAMKSRVERLEEKV